MPNLATDRSVFEQEGLMSRLLYENSIATCGYLVIPFSLGTIAGESFYSYTLLSEWGRRGQYHKLDNPAGLFSNSIEAIVKIAAEHLANHSDIAIATNYFQNRYTYRNHLIIVFGEAGKYFYDHYPQDTLSNIAAPKIFNSQSECLSWVQQGLDRNYSIQSI